MGLDFSKKVCYNNFRCGGVAQLVRAFGSHPRGRGFEPLRLHHLKNRITPSFVRCLRFLLCLCAQIPLKIWCYLQICKSSPRPEEILIGGFRRVLFSFVKLLQSPIDACGRKAVLPPLCHKRLYLRPILGHSVRREPVHLRAQCPYHSMAVSSSLLPAAAEVSVSDPFLPMAPTPRREKIYPAYKAFSATEASAGCKPWSKKCRQHRNRIYRRHKIKRFFLSPVQSTPTVIPHDMRAPLQMFSHKGFGRERLLRGRRIGAPLRPDNSL